MSSVPVQFLVVVVNTSTCSIPPEVVGIPLEDSCTPVVVGQTFSSRLIAINNCGPTVAIDDIATLSFAHNIQSNVTKQNSTTYYKSFSWTPTAAQAGYQVMCAMALDRYIQTSARMASDLCTLFSRDVQSSQYCFTFYVSPNAITDCPGKTTPTTTTS